MQEGSCCLTAYPQSRFLLHFSKRLHLLFDGLKRHHQECGALRMAQKDLAGAAAVTWASRRALGPCKGLPPVAWISTTGKDLAMSQSGRTACRQRSMKLLGLTLDVRMVRSAVSSLQFHFSKHAGWHSHGASIRGKQHGQGGRPWS